MHSKTCDCKVTYIFSQVALLIRSESVCVCVWVGGVRACTLRLRRPLFCCCCCSMSSMAEAGGEAALMALTTLMLSSGSGGRSRRSRLRTFISWSSSKPPNVNWIFLYTYMQTFQKKNVKLIQGLCILQ